MGKKEFAEIDNQERREKEIHNISCGRALRKLREKKNISQGQAANKSNMDQSYLSNIENGKHTVSSFMLISILKGINVKVEDFMKDYTKESNRIINESGEFDGE